ncbi:unnamed protein product [Parascedosporium putredinis]|uniref:Arrestin C-terminal-like domain-containing protein n=1 Tax=Parascedosporium putredinis TaxID=1442378 RepID=A0A9P1H9R6_9PEZI|nr:unnamed protein product [Parascedosporium putredinis]CAI8001247.1 unnamed protein product [Parascedosporium putredinis]
MAALVRVSGPPNSSFLVGYPGISATLPRIEGTVEIRPSQGYSAPVSISLDANRKIPPASLSLGSRTAETFYELVVTVQQGHTHSHKYAFPITMQRYDTLSTFGMYNKPEFKTAVSDNIVTLGMSLPRWSYGPSDPLTIYIRVAPNPDWMSKAKRRAYKKINKIIKHNQPVKAKLTEAGYTTNLGLVFPSKSIRDSDGIIRREKPGFPLYEVSSFTTSSTLYKIEFFVCIKAHLSSARDITVRQPIVICPMDHQECKEILDAIEQSAKDAAHVDPNRPPPRPTIIKASDKNALESLGLCMVGGQKKPLID